MFSRIELCVRLKIYFFQANEIVGFGGLNYFFLVILSEVATVVPLSFQNISDEYLIFFIFSLRPSNHKFSQNLDVSHFFVSSTIIYDASNQEKTFNIPPKAAFNNVDQKINK
jgi:hypothetical protein